MSAPATPNDFKSMAPDLNAPACEVLDRWLVGFPTLWSKVYRDYFYGDGLCSDISEIECSADEEATTEETTDGTTGEAVEPALNLVFICSPTSETCPGEYRLASAYATGGSIISMDAEVGDCYAPDEVVTITAEVLGDDGNTYTLEVESTMGSDCGTTTTPTTTTTTSTGPCEDTLTVTVTNPSENNYFWNDIRLCSDSGCSTAWMPVGVSIPPGESAIYVIDVSSFGCCVSGVDQVVIAVQDGPIAITCQDVSGPDVEVSLGGANDPDCPICS